ncbi:MAG: hypothetical protein V3T72_19040 [Thermoanaerobaculia bacterium]
MARQGALHLDLVAIVRGHEVRRYQQQDDVGVLETLVDLALPLRAGEDLAVVPDHDRALALERLQMGAEGAAQGLVLVGVGQEDFGRERTHGQSLPDSARGEPLKKDSQAGFIRRRS